MLSSDCSISELQELGQSQRTEIEHAALPTLLQTDSDRGSTSLQLTIQNFHLELVLSHSKNVSAHT